MSRTSHNLDQKLLKTGKKLLIKKGASGLSIRELTSLANVNLGMFSYHFKNKDNFIEQVLAAIYEELLAELNLNKENIADPLERLKAYLLTISYFARNNRKLIVSLFKDILEEEQVVQRFVRKTMRKHFWLLAATIKAAKRQNMIIDAPLIFIITHLVGSIGLTNLTPVILQRSGVHRVFDLALKVATQQIDSDEAIRLRIDITINSLKISQ